MTRTVRAPVTSAVAIAGSVMSQVTLTSFTACPVRSIGVAVTVPLAPTPESQSSIGVSLMNVTFCRTTAV